MLAHLLQKKSGVCYLFFFTLGLCIGLICVVWKIVYNKLCGRPPQYVPAPYKLTFDLLTLKVVSQSCVTWATSVLI